MHAVLPAFLALILFTVHSASPQTPDETPPGAWTFLPGGLAFTPLAANYQEPRVGVRKEIGSSKLKLDIGSTVDLLEYKPEPLQACFRMGIDFFTYALTTSAEGLRLQVDAVDGYFGGHIAYVNVTESRIIALRLRILHVSGHLIDGHWDRSAKAWKENKEPIPYTRDFGELAGVYTWPGTVVTMTLYAGVSYATLVRPDDLARWGTLQGLEIRTNGLLGSLFGKPFVLYCADHLSITGVPTWYGTNNLEFGAKLGPWGGTGVKVYVSYYSGLEAFSQYYYIRREQWGLGFAIDFW